MKNHLIFLQTVISKPLQTLLEDITPVLESGIGRTNLFAILPGEEESSSLALSLSVFIDDIVEERLVVNSQTKQTYVVYRVFVHSKEEEVFKSAGHHHHHHHSAVSYGNVGWLLKEGMPVCNLCRSSFSNETDKQHCVACGNIYCLFCCRNLSVVQGLEDCGRLQVCSLCDYGQEVVVPVTTRVASRFEITNLADVTKKKGMNATAEMHVFDTKNRKNLEKGLDITSICLEPIHIDPELAALKEQNKRASKKFLTINPTAPLQEMNEDSNAISESIASNPSSSRLIVGAKPEFMAELENQEDPPVLSGWLKKKEDELTVAWKTRYCVLIRGFLYIYMDKLDVPPFGRYLKSQICLAGYRPFADTPLSIRNTSRFAQQSHLNQLNSIHLIHSPGICPMEVVLTLAKDLSLDANYFSSSSHSDTSNGTDFQPELLLEAEDYDDRMTWLLTIKHHINYLEAKAKTVRISHSREPSPSVIAHSSRNNSTGSRFFESLSRQSSENSVASNASTSTGNGMLLNAYMTPERQNSSPGPSSLIRARLVNTVGQGRFDGADERSNVRWKKFLLPTEEEIFSGTVCKPDATSKKKLIFVKTNPMTGILPFQTRPDDPLLLLTQTPSRHRYVKRLLYVDTDKDVVKGQIKWYPEEKAPKVRKIDDRCFELIDYHVHKAYLFYPRDDCTVNQWIQVLETA